MTGLLKGLQPYNPTWKHHGTGGGTSFTLDVSSTTNATILIVGGVIQLAGTDYTVSGTTVTTTTSVTSGVEVISAVLYDLGSVTTPAAGSVNFDSLGFTSQAQGDILYRDSSTWARLPAGTSGQFLKTQGTGANPTWGTVSGGGYEYVTNTSASGTSVEFEGRSGNYDYLLVVKSLKPSTDAHIDVTFGTGTSYVAANYQYQVLKAQQSTVTCSGNDGSGQTAIRLTIATMGAGSGEYIDGVFEVFNLGDANHNTSMFGRYVAEDAGGTEHMMLTGGRYEVNAAQTDIKFSVSTGTFSSGSISLFRRPNA